MSEADLITALGVSRANVYRHITQLRFGKLVTWETDGHGRYTFFFPTPPQVKASLKNETETANESQSRKNETHVVVVDPLIKDININTTTTESQSRKNETNSPIYAQALTYLVRAGVWTDRAERLADRLVANEQRLEYGNDHLPTLADILGWIAYCCDPDQKIGNLAPVLAANIENDRRAPEEYRPPFVCRTCKLVQGSCECETPDLYLPDEFLEAAFGRKDPNRRYAISDTNEWGICLYCHAFPCQCEVEDDPEAEEEGEKS